MQRLSRLSKLLDHDSCQPIRVIETVFVVHTVILLCIVVIMCGVFSWALRELVIIMVLFLICDTVLSIRYRFLNSIQVKNGPIFLNLACFNHFFNFCFLFFEFRIIADLLLSFIIYVIESEL